jgi:hypothetical protein
MADLSALYPQPPAPTKPIDPFQIIGALGALNANQRFQAEFGAQKAIGEEYRNALTPDGRLDVPRLVTGLKTNPATGIGLPEATSRMIGQQGGQFENFAKMNSVITNGIGALAADPTLTKEKLADWATTTARTTGMPGAVVAPWLLSLPDDPRKLRDAVRTLSRTSIGAAGTAETIPYVDQNTGRTLNVPKGAAISASAGGIPGAVPASLPAGGEKSAGVMQEDLGRARNFGQDIFPMQQALDAANKLKEKYGEGYFAPGSKGRQEFQSYFYGISPTVARWLGGDPEKLKEYAKADKYLTQAMQTRASNFGTHTDQALATAISGSPNVGVNDLAVEDVLKSSIALRRAEHAQTLSASQAGGPNYTGAAARWPAQHDIRAFAVDLMTPEARAKLLGSFRKGSPEWVKFNNSLREAYESGVMARPGKSNPGGN